MRAWILRNNRNKIGKGSATGAVRGERKTDWISVALVEELLEGELNLIDIGNAPGVAGLDPGRKNTGNDDGRDDRDNGDDDQELDQSEPRLLVF